jgi:hypothetical protein
MLIVICRCGSREQIVWSRSIIARHWTTYSRTLIRGDVDIVRAVPDFSLYLSADLNGTLVRTSNLAASWELSSGGFAWHRAATHKNNKGSP